MTKKKGFVLSWFFPPGNSSEGLITYKLLSNSKCDYDVWTRSVHARNVWDRKVEEKKLVSDNINVIAGYYEQEDSWLKDAIKYFLKHQDEYDFIMTRSMPAEAHEFGHYIKKKIPTIKWIASFGDPLTNTPYHKYLGKLDALTKIQVFMSNEKITIQDIADPIYKAENRLRNKMRIRNNKDLDRLARINNITIKNADILILNNPYQYQHIFESPYQQFKSKGVVIPHSYDESLISVEPKTKNKKITFVYVGHLDKNRNAHTLLKALDKLKKFDSHIGTKICFDFYGTLPDTDKCYITDHNLGDIVKVNGSIDYKTSLQKAKNADWALLFDANFAHDAEKNVYFAAKIVDYFGVKANIFAITNPNGASAEAIREANCGIISTHAIDDIFMNLCRIIYKKETPPKYNEKVREKYNAKNVGKKLDETIAKLCDSDNN